MYPARDVIEKESNNANMTASTGNPKVYIIFRTISTYSTVFLKLTNNLQYTLL